MPRGIFNLHRGRLDLDRSIGVLEQGRFHLERGRLDVDQDIPDLDCAILDLDSPGLLLRPARLALRMTWTGRAGGLTKSN